MYMTVTAFRGCLFSSTWPIQDERGRTPSRATAKIRREAATIATLVPCARRCQPLSGKVAEGIYHDQTQYRDDGHENTRPSAQRQSVELDERLGSIQGKEGVQIWGAEQEEDCGE